MDASNDGSESVDQFLARIASLTLKQGEEDAERSRKMEEEMMQARKERQARRAERARSLSPSKTGPTPTLRSVVDTTPVQTRGIDPPVVLTPQSRPQTLGRSGSISPRAERPSLASVDFNRPLPPHPSPADHSPSVGNSTNATSLSRSGTLSWNQRPLSRAGAIGSVRSRPQSVASIPDSCVGRPPSPSKDAPEMSRQDIAASLASRDPSWFRQTSDRGLSSAAYRKNETDSSETTATSFGRGMRLPGMAKESSSIPGKNIQADGPQTSTTSSPSIPSGEPSYSRHDSSADRAPATTRPLSTISLTPSKSPALDQPYLRSLDLPSPSDPDAPGIARTSSVLSTSRPSSPTKGLGGFVQSAMMKRSDSVSKRWSVQASAGLKRGDSVATSRPAHLQSLSGFTPGHSRGSSRDVRGFKDGESSPLSTSRPVSSHGSDPVPILKSSTPRVDDSAPAAKSNPLSEHDHSEAVTSPPQEQKPPSTQQSSEDLLSRSPSKTLDPRRWSPTKASWLESALQKPDAPRFTKKPEIPAWKLDMQRSKEQRVKSPELGQSTEAKDLDSTPAGGNLSLAHSESHGKTPTSATPRTDQQAVKSIPGTGNPSSNNIIAPLQQDEKPAVPSKRNLISKDVSRAEEQPKPDSSSLVQGIESASEPRPAEHTPVKVESKSTILKPKPQTPPKTDFRAALKARQPASNDNNGTEPEFKAVFGKLKRTQTQNYVAPDLLKDNITRGKAALAVTGGPQQTKRVDEFKESILQKKEAMKAAGGSTSKRPESMEASKPKHDEIPEALIRRNALQKTNSLPDTESRKLPDVSKESSRTFPAKIDKPQKPPVLSQKESPPTGSPAWKGSQTPVTSPSKATPPSAVPKPLPKEKSLSEPIPSNYGQKLPGSNVVKKEDRDQVTLPVSSVARPIQANIPPKSSASEKSNLAARLNPALAGFLSRSGSPRLPGDPPSEGNQYGSQSSGRMVSTAADQPSAGLTHMTKGRAKGPKRRTPKDNQSGRNSKPKANSLDRPPKTSEAEAPQSASPAPEQASKSATLPLASSVVKPSPRKPSAGIEVSKTPSGPPSSTTTPKGLLSPSSLSDSLAESAKRAVAAPSSTPEPFSKSKPIVAKKSEELRKVSSSEIPESSNAISSRPATPKKFSVLSDQQSRLDAQDKPAVISKTPLNAATMPLTPSKSKLNTPKSKPEADTDPKSSLASSGKANGVGVRIDSPHIKPLATSELTPPSESQLSAGRSKPIPPKPSQKPLQSTTNAHLVRTQLEAILGPLPQSTDRAEFDTHSFLSSQAPGEKVKTVNHQIWEVGAGGKKIPMPPQQEHILFEDSMYLSIHVMQISNGTQTSEAYLWCGDEVSEAAIEDAQLFCRKAARENNAKLEIIRQGKEKSEFFQGLGGIVIIRRNKTSALYMLCGRRHLGHVAFDEVDFAPDQLTSGLPFLISAKFGKLYLWKGASSNPEDVGCARLIGMDLGLTGEIEEISEGEEPASFWESFPYTSGKRKTTAGRSESDRHRGQSTRLYRVELDRPKSSGGFWGLRAASPSKPSNKALIEEIRPFTQQDLDASCIQILDVYSELYVIVGQSARKPVEFITALQVAQEMAVLSPSVQDRPFLPTCHVISGDIPDNIKATFRKWKPTRSTLPQGSISARAEDVMQELGIVS
ncbi:hypothetical protein PV10_05250 [Exophiala mesophila]|uniref:Uncharacterized protein n=1 Tax=Exophiala mesophila TaxID=212818 RepID=A0A0D1WXH3_EXOME|nr:uncharacterized protein PV10_05250 [Exophiala mesophila]KIV94095.1 hypothetical protein PV10_05250 [Exophiala mesophila]